MLRALTAGVVLCLPSCSLFFDARALGSDRTGDGEGGADASLEAEAGANPAGGTNGCPSERGPRMVRVDDQCIDGTEVTVAQYRDFLRFVGADAGGPALPACANTDLTPVDPSEFFPPEPPTKDNDPVRAITWCAAKAYCLWADKDLCGSVHGAPLSVAQASDPKVSLWAKACSHDGTQRFPYGSGYVRGNCTLSTQGVGTAASGKCEGGYPGLFDMVGNVTEWANACNEPLLAHGLCAGLGGAYDDDEGADCKRVHTVPFDVPWQSFGIRCCASAREQP